MSSSSIIYYLDVNLKEIDSESIEIPLYVRKKIRKKENKNILDNEIYWLNKLSKLDFVPKIINTNDMEYTMDYVGVPVQANNLPDNWRIQVDIILDKLEKNKCCHNDIKNEEILIMNDKIYLIDFQHATITREEFFRLKKAGICKSRIQTTDHDSLIIILTNIEKLKKEME